MLRVERTRSKQVGEEKVVNTSYSLNSVALLKMSKYIVPGKRAQSRDVFRPPSHRLSRLENQERAVKRFSEHWKSCGKVLDSTATMCLTDRGSTLVQPMRRLQKGELHNGQDQFAFLELQLDSKSPGWLYNPDIDLVAFEVRDGFVQVQRVDLLSIQIDVSEVPVRWFRFPRQIYRRLFAPDVNDYPNGLMLTLVSLDDILSLPSAQKVQLERQ